MRSAYTFLELIGVGFAICGRLVWFRSSQSFGPDVNGLDSLASIKPWLDNVAHYNRTATLCAAFAAICAVDNLGKKTQS
jgi:hypothetical protein